MKENHITTLTMRKMACLTKSFQKVNFMSATTMRTKIPALPPGNHAVFVAVDPITCRLGLPNIESLIGKIRMEAAWTYRVIWTNQVVVAIRLT